MKESVTDEEKEISSRDSFNSDLSHSKNYIPKEAWLMRNSGSFVNNSSNYKVKSQSQNFINFGHNDSKANSITRREIDSTVIN